MNARARPPIRIFRVSSGARRGDGRLLLHDGQALFDLSAYLMRRGQPDDLVELAESGWFDASQLEPILPSSLAREAENEESAGEGTATETSAWEEVELEWDGNAPPETLLPLARGRVGKILCLGKNFRAHAQEFGEEVPEEMLFFNKLPETLVPHGAQVSVPSWYTRRVDHEAELAVVVGLGGREIALEDALEHVAGYTVANDLTARSLQGDDRQKSHPWFRSKNMDGFCPLGPCFVPRDFLELEALELRAEVNGEPRQSASLSQMVIDVPHAIASLSRHISLHPGDLILMGTPAGVSPLADGDEVVCSIAGIGSLRTTIRRPS